MPDRQIDVVPKGGRFLVVDRQLWDIEKTSPDTPVIARAGILSFHDSEAEALAARDQAIADLGI